MRVKRFRIIERPKRLERFQSFKTFNPFKHERGVALVVVLWIFIFLFVVVVEFSSSAREEGLAAHRHAEEIEGYYLALAGFQAGLYRLFDTSAAEDGVPRGTPLAQRLLDAVDGEWREEDFGAGHYRVRLIDETGKVNLNRVDEATLRRIFINLSVEEPERSVLADSIMDWRDEDDLHRTSGAEKDYYLSLSPRYAPQNGPFGTVEELLWVRGVTPELFYGVNGDVGLRQIFSVDSPIDRVNLRTAPAEVIHALLGIPLEKSRAVIEERKKLSEKTIADMLKLLGLGAGDAALRQFIFTNPSVVTVEAAGRPENSAIERRVKGVVRIAGGAEGFTILRWVDRDAAGENWR